MRARATSLAVVLGLGLIVAARLLQAPIDGYGDSAAQYIEHLARLRMVLRIDQGVGPDPLSALVQLDGLYPPGLHLLTAALSPLIGHRAEAVVWTGLLWWVGLALATGRAAQALRPDAGPWALVATAAIPALHASATRYYYDLPMTALLWTAVCVLLHAGRGRAVLRGVVAGGLFAAACAIKWSALPFGLPLVAGALAVVARSDRPRAARAGLAAAGVAGVLVGAFVLGGSTSFGAMSGATFQPPPGTEPTALAALASLPGGPALRAMLLQAAALDGPRLGFYPVRLVATVLGPVLTLAALPLLGSWLRDRAPGWPLLLLGLGGTAAFVLLLVPPLDDRFLLTLAPAIGLAAGLGAAALPERARPAVAGIGTLLALGTAADLHLRPPSTPLHAAAGQLRDDVLDGRTVAPRPGVGSSWDLRGWARSDTARQDRTALRAALDARLSRCGDAALDAAAPGSITAFGEDNWFAYREALAALEGRALGPRWPTGAPSTATLAVRSDPPGALGGPTDTLPPHRWTVADPDGGPGLLLAGSRAGLCPPD